MLVWHPDMDVRCGVPTAARLPGVQGTVLYEGSDVRTVNGFVLPRDRWSVHRQNIAEETR